MPVDYAAARTFVYANARLVETRLFATLFEGADPTGVARAVEAYRNDDGGFGHALEPDKRCPASQPEDVIFALELLALAGADGTAIATAACTFLAGVADESGAVPLALRSVLDYPRAEHWNGDWAYEPGLWGTSSAAGWVHAFGVTHPWLDRATAYCFAELEGDTGAHLDAHGIREALRFLRNAPDAERAKPLRDALIARLPSAPYFLADPTSEEYGLSPLEFDDEVVARDVLDAHLDRLEATQLADGGWGIAWEPPSEAARLEWRGYRTVRALLALRRHGRLS
jgi:hypothetical protein